jgi:hypothetical protein
VGDSVSAGWRDQVLQQLDASAEAFTLPGIPNEYLAQAAQRLTVFRGDDEWLLVFQIVGWSKREDAFENLVTAYGNKVEDPGSIKLAEPVVTGPGGKSPWAEDGNFLLDVEHLEFEIRGRSHTLEPTAEDLRAAGVDDDTMPAPARVIRLIAHKFHDELFLSHAELLEACERADAKLDVFLEVDGWVQPDLVEGEKPSEMPCLQSLAEAVEAGDASRFSCPKSDWNTHWSGLDDD